MNNLMQGIMHDHTTDCQCMGSAMLLSSLRARRPLGLAFPWTSGLISRPDLARLVTEVCEREEANT